MKFVKFMIAWFLMFSLLTGYLIIGGTQEVQAVYSSDGIYTNFESGTNDGWTSAPTLVSAYHSNYSTFIGNSDANYFDHASVYNASWSEWYCSFYWKVTAVQTVMVNTLLIDGAGWNMAVNIRLSDVNINVYNAGVTTDSGLNVQVNTWEFFQVHYLNGNIKILLNVTETGWMSTYNRAGLTDISMACAASQSEYVDNFYFGAVPYNQSAYYPITPTPPGPTPGGNNNYMDQHLIDAVFILIILLIPSCVMGYIAGHVGFCITVSMMTIIIIMTNPGFLIPSVMIWITSAVIIWSGD